MSRLGIVVALPAELRTLSRRRIATGRLLPLNETTLAALSGAGPACATVAAERLLDQGATALLGWGCAAGLDDTLEPGRLVLPEAVMTTDGHRFRVDPAWHRRLHRLLSQRLRIDTGAVIASDRLVLQATEKAELFARFRGAALDMESGAIARVSNERRVPFAIVRAVADPAGSDLPTAVAHALDAKGRIDLGRLLSYALPRPAELVRLMQLGWYFHAARRTLRRSVKPGGNAFAAPTGSHGVGTFEQAAAAADARAP